MREMRLNDWTQWLNEPEFTELQKLADNPLLLQAIEKVLCHEIYHNGVLKAGEKADFSRNFLLAYVSAKGGEVTNEKLGEDVRSYFWGLHALELGLKELAKFKKEEERSKEPENPGI